jgi:hypothetical protein
MPGYDPSGIPNGWAGASSKSDSARRLRLYGAALAGLAVVPIFVAELAEAYVFYVLPQLHWVNLAWRARGVPMYLSFEFWEWITCVVLSCYIGILSIAA